MKKYTYEEFLDIIKLLRSENGCPWDREQTHMSLRSCLTEEAAEVLAGIRILEQTGNADNLVEELGDVLLQVVMHAQIGSEEGLFSMEDVVNEVATKMVRRHPHVFGTVTVDGSEEVLQNWEEIKKKEKEGRQEAKTPLREIPIELPALTRATKVLKKVDKHYAEGNSYRDNIQTLKDTVAILETLDPESKSPRLEKEIARLLMAVSDINRICKLNGEQILSDQVDDLIDCYENIQ